MNDLTPPAPAASPFRQQPQMSFQPVGNRIVVKRKAAADKSEGGIIIPAIAREKMAEGEVIQIGRGRVQEDGSIRPFDVNVGDRIVFSKHAGTDVKVNGEDLLILQEDDIFGILVPALETGRTEITLGP